MDGGQNNSQKDEKSTTLDESQRRLSELAQKPSACCEAEKLALSALPEHEEQLWKEYQACIHEDEQHAHQVEEHAKALAVASGEDHAPQKNTHQKAPSSKDNQAALEKFSKDLEALPSSDVKLSFALDFMEQAISQSGSPNFKRFWEARKICVELFKDESIPQAGRAHLWNRYVELSKEARRLKDILDEQSSFAAEQIEIAINALEKEITQISEFLLKSAEIKLPPEAKVLKTHFDQYNLLQKELNLLNTFASRINGLRKELIKTEMRIRIKHKFFQRLSTAGDQIFPRRKDLIRDVSQLFMEDVEKFISYHFDDRLQRESFFVLREEIKALQNAAKLLTLNTLSFTQTRTRLSEFWDKIKELEKERKKERAQQKVIFKQNAQVIYQQIEEFKTLLQNSELTANEANSKLQEINANMREQKLDRDEVQSLRNALNDLRKQISDRVKHEEDLRLQQAEEKERNRRAEVESFKAKIEDLITKVGSHDADYLLDEREKLSEEIRQSLFTKLEKIELEKHLKPIRELIADKKEKAILALSADDRNALEQLIQILEERKEQRQEIRTQIEQYRKAGGSSGLDFQKAMSFNQMLTEEKERLDKINHNIREIETKIDQIRDKA